VSASLRFLVIAVVGWAGLRAASLGMVPGAEVFTLRHGKAAAEPASAGSSMPPIAATEFPPIEPPALAAAPQMAPFQLASLPMPRVERFYYYPASLPGAAVTVPLAPLPPRPARRFTHIEPTPEPLFYSPIPQLDDWPLSRLASAGMPVRRSAIGTAQQSIPLAIAQHRLDRLQLTAWALLRGRQGQLAGPDSLAAGGQLGASQAGARLTYSLNRWAALSLRTSSDVGRRGGEVAGGVRLVPFRAIPIAFTAERRQAIGRDGGGRSAFALFAEGGIYQQPIGWGFDLDSYLQAGIVGARSRDLFIDGSASLTRPVFGAFSAGLGVWGGAQPGLYRIDAGPRVTLKVRNNMRVHFDWRQRLAGNARPGSGPAVTLAADF
jgi:hypothetical protein